MYPAARAKSRGLHLCQGLPGSTAGAGIVVAAAGRIEIIRSGGHRPLNSLAVQERRRDGKTTMILYEPARDVTAVTTCFHATTCSLALLITLRDAFFSIHKLRDGSTVKSLLYYWGTRNPAIKAYEIEEWPRRSGRIDKRR
jgi:hypothetical protein